MVNKKLSAKQFRQKQANSYELNFENFCSENGIGFIRLDRDKEAQERFLENPRGKSSDFLCQKNDKHIFVEVKTHTLLTNEARNKAMVQTIQAKKAAGLSGTTLFEPFDPIPELKVPFEGHLRDASKKFKNVKEEYNYPRILLLYGMHVERFDAHAVFLGAYPSFRMDGSYAGLKKEHKGLFDSTGSSVSALVYWSPDLKRYEGIANPRAKIILSEEYFRLFFEITNA